MSSKVEAEVPLVRNKRKLTKIGDMVPTREGTSTKEVVLIGDGVGQKKEEREAVEEVSAREGPRAGDRAEEARAELPLVIVPFE